jgi:nucleoid DNA-binding protein
MPILSRNVNFTVDSNNLPHQEKSKTKEFKKMNPNRQEHKTISISTWPVVILALLLIAMLLEGNGALAQELPQPPPSVRFGIKTGGGPPPTTSEDGLPTPAELVDEVRQGAQQAAATIRSVEAALQACARVISEALQAREAGELVVTKDCAILEANEKGARLGILIGTEETVQKGVADIVFGRSQLAYYRAFQVKEMSDVLVECLDETGAITSAVITESKSVTVQVLASLSDLLETGLTGEAFATAVTAVYSASTVEGVSLTTLSIKALTRGCRVLASVLLPALNRESVSLVFHEVNLNETELDIEQSPDESSNGG